jgi:hypothetical protein
MCNGWENIKEPVIVEFFAAKKWVFRWNISGKFSGNTYVFEKNCAEKIVILKTISGSLACLSVRINY